MSGQARTLPAVPGFELVRRIGRGGMGEVFHAIRVGPGGFRKTVALKQLAEDHGASGRARQRFLEEAHVSAQLDHPNLVRVHDVIVVGSQHYIVMELLRGLNLLDAADALRARGAIPWQLALAVAMQVLDGLAYAHDATDETGRTLSLVHRDLTPRNLFLCLGGVAKLVDFGIAKRQDGPLLTHSGHVHGTIELLSPEQARGEPVDRRSDLYQLGATLYWLLSNRFPHGDGTAGELIARAATQRPTPLGDLVRDVPVSVLAVIERAMATAPDDRFVDAAAMQAALRASGEMLERSALADTIASLPLPDPEASASGQTISATDEHTASLPVAPAASAAPAAPVAPVPADAVRRSPVWRVIVAAASLAAIAFALGILVARARHMQPITSTPSPSPGWQQLTFDPARLGEARFETNGARYVYAASNAGRMAVREATFGKPHGRVIVDDAQLVALSRQADLLVLLHPEPVTFVLRGTLARVPVDGGGPRELATDTTAADISADNRIVAVRHQPGHDWIELPLGHTVVESSTAWYSDVRFSPAGNLVAYVEHPAFGDDRGFVTVLDRAGVPRRIGTEWGTIGGLVWRTADELWITASRTSGTRELYAVNLAGVERALQHVPGGVRLADIDAGGRALVVSEHFRERTIGDLDGHGLRYLPSIVGSYPTELSPDGRWFVIPEGSGDSAGGEYVFYKAPVDGASPPIQLGIGMVQRLSPDGNWVLAIAKRRDALSLVPFAAGSARTLPIGELRVDSATWFPDSRHLLLTAVAPGEAPRLYTMDTDSTALPRALGRAELQRCPDFCIPTSPVSNDGSQALLFDRATNLAALVDIRDGSERPARGLQPGEYVVRWTSDRRVLVRRDLGPDLVEVDLDTGARQLRKRVESLDPSAANLVSGIWISDDLTRYLATEVHFDGMLFVVDNLR